jgi:superfamily II DNA or RNA helicase/HKD family nuclease
MAGPDVTSPPFAVALSGTLIAQDDLAMAAWAPSPVDAPHVLVWPRVPASSWFDLPPDVQRAMLDLAATVRAKSLRGASPPAGFTLEIDVPGTAEVPSAHLRLIPRPARPTTYEFGRATLVTPGEKGLLRALVHLLAQPDYDRIDLLVSFVMRSGIDLLAEAIEDALRREGTRLRVLTTDYLAITDADALGWLLDRASAQLQVRLYSEANRSFHPKAYLFRSTRPEVVPTAFVGSSNLSRSALRDGIEWNLGVHNTGALEGAFEALWDSPHARPVDARWLADYARRSRPARSDETAEAAAEIATGLVPNLVQHDALRRLETTRSDGFRKALVVLATGLGKTLLAAFDSNRVEYKRVAFLAHREELLLQARDAFRRLRPGARFSFFLGDTKDLDGDVVFASVQSLHNALDRIDPRVFDYVVVDEFHHAEARTYREVLARLAPSFLLGLTATPNRTDEADIAALCDDNVLRVCELVEGIGRGLLSPFHYRGVLDVVDYAGIPFRRGRFDETTLARAVSTEERAHVALAEWERAQGTCGIGFCVSIDHADFMKEYFAAREVVALAVHSGPRSAPRAEALEQFRAGEVQVLFTVDLFNEGIDVPEVDTVLMLRPTESPVVFLQQLGRGLRYVKGKTLRVVDVVANHRSALVKARVLASFAGYDVDGTDEACVARLRRPMPEGIVLDLGEVVGLLEELAKAGREEPLCAFVDAWIDQYGVRPTLTQVLRGGAFAKAERAKTRGWAGWLGDRGYVDALPEATCTWLRRVERGWKFTKAFTLVALEQFALQRGLAQPVSTQSFSLACRDALLCDAHLRRDLATVSVFARWMEPPDDEWVRWWDDAAVRPLVEARILRVVGDTLAADLGVEGHSEQTASMLDEVLAARRATYLDRLLPVFRADAPTSTEFDAQFSVARREGGFEVFIECRGGRKGAPNQRNFDYNNGFDRCLARLRTLQARLDGARVASMDVQHLPGERTSILPTPIYLETVDDLAAFRKVLTKRAKAVSASNVPTKGGNDTKRVALTVTLPTPITRDDLEHYLAWGSIDGIPVAWPSPSP